MSRNAPAGEVALAWTAWITPGSPASTAEGTAAAGDACASAPSTVGSLLGVSSSEGGATASVPCTVGSSDGVSADSEGTTVAGVSEISVVGSVG